jgi:RHS repeat-associated protein
MGKAYDVESIDMMQSATYSSSVASAVRPHSSGKERDAESGNDYMFARYYNSATGRFLSPDWSAKEEPVPYAKLDNPQTLNLYGYVGNNPMSKVDADGHQEDEGEAEPELMEEVRIEGALEPWKPAPAIKPLPQDALTRIMGQEDAKMAQLLGEKPISGESLQTAKGAPKPSPNFLPPENSPSNPPKTLPDGHSVRVEKPTEQYPDGYWVQSNKGGQPVDPRTGKPTPNVTRPVARSKTHVPLPAKDAPKQEESN